ncbi:low molecular weight phosphatase family protein [Alphaproteobacteria bacterium]|jgi:protein-tyrosine-phosphatase|nr:low molecular weight phosphatase family protein [Alphaproteobacteria bacterium]MBT5799016.1 low molecular weight phosphatase family protein [Alphaproteobacteria bacterium]MDC0461584.1 low molecular weight phosphatase family protein [Alphaproteobacteria bacterium]MDC3312085.1 low molecular weight phosphatase family protein [Alphaproteobacteria bacterium]
MQKKVKQVLFSCTLNAIRSVMAEGFFNVKAPAGWQAVSCGVIAGAPDGFTFAVMEESGITLDLNRQSKLFNDFRSSDIDYAVSLSLEAQFHLETWAQGLACEHWTVREPFSSDENREVQLQTYRLIRDEISLHVDKLISQITNNT